MIALVEARLGRTLRRVETYVGLSVDLGGQSEILTAQADVVEHFGFRDWDAYCNAMTDGADPFKEFR